MKTIEIIVDNNNENYFLKEAFNTLRTNLIFSGKGIKTIVVTSCFAHEGKSTVALELARNLAEAGKQILLVDADLRKSVMVTRHTKERGICGLSQLLSGQTTIENTVYHTQITGLDIVFSGPYPPNPTELVGQPAFKEFLADVRDAYDYIFVDAPPLGLVIDAAVIGGVCDGSIIVMNAGQVKYRMARAVKEQLEKSGCKILGVVLNQTRRRHTSSSGYYKSRYAEYQSGLQMSHARMVQQQQRVVANPAVRPAPPTGTRPAQGTPAPAPRQPRPTPRPMQDKPKDE